MSTSDKASREVVVWRPLHERPEFKAKEAEKAQVAAVKTAKNDEALAKAQANEEYHRMNTAARKLVVTQLEKLLDLAQDPDYAHAPGPLDIKDLIRLAAMVANEHRLNHGLATANIAHAVTSNVDFSKFSQAERDLWRELAVKAGAEE